MLQVVDANVSAIIIKTGLHFSLVFILLSFLKEKNRVPENGLFRCDCVYLLQLLKYFTDYHETW